MDCVQLTDQYGETISSTEFGKKFLASAASFDEELTRKILDCKKWREDYDVLVTEVVKMQSQSDKIAIESCENALNFFYNNLRYKRKGKSYRLDELGALVPENDFFSAKTVIGEKYTDSSKRDYSVEGYRQAFKPSLFNIKKKLHVPEIVPTVQTWSKQGFIEETAVKKVKWVVSNQQQIDASIDNFIFVLFGANSELGPFKPLLEAGNATIVAIDLPIPRITKQLVSLAEHSKAKVYFPKHGDKIGANIVSQVPELIKWLSELEPEKRMVIGNYAYADGAKFVKIAAAMDAITMAVGKNRGQDKIGVSYLMSPTDVFVARESMARISRAEFQSRNSFSKAAHQASKGKYCRPNYPDSAGSVCNNVVSQQGPNYLLAKKMQQWRTILLLKDGYKVSSNIAPASSTVSVEKNAIFKLAYGGSVFFGLKIFTPEESRSLMTMEILYDMFTDTPFVKKPEQSILEYFVDGACHGKMLVSGLRLDSFIELAAVIKVADSMKRPILGLTAGAIGIRYVQSKL